MAASAMRALKRLPSNRLVSKAGYVQRAYSQQWEYFMPGKSKNFLRLDPQFELEEYGINDSLGEKLEKVRLLDPVYAKNRSTQMNNVGHPVHFREISRRERFVNFKERRSLEAASRHNKIVVDPELIAAGYLSPSGLGLLHAKGVLEHYGIYKDLLGNDTDFFYPVRNLKVGYALSDSEMMPVYRGNRLLAAETSEKPVMEIGSLVDQDAKQPEFSVYHSVLLVSLDSHLHKDDGEYLHWCLGNIPSGESSHGKGEESVSYLAPIPLRGTGFHRYVYLLLEHEQPLAALPTIATNSPVSLSNRDFCTREFLQEVGPTVRPVGLQFFQCEWDDSVTNTFHHTLDMEQPAYEYDHPEPYHPEQKFWPLREPFNRYMDRYRDRKEIKEQVLKEKLKVTCPFRGEDPGLPYPLAVPYDRKDGRPQIPTWLRIDNQERATRKPHGKWKYWATDD